MNDRDIWRQWIVHRQSTAEIARQLKLKGSKLKECDVDSIIADCINAQYDGSPMPWDRFRVV